MKFLKKLQEKIFDNVLFMLQEKLDSYNEFKELIHLLGGEKSGSPKIERLKNQIQASFFSYTFFTSLIFFGLSYFFIGYVSFLYVAVLLILGILAINYNIKQLVTFLGLLDDRCKVLAKEKSKQHLGVKDITIDKSILKSAISSMYFNQPNTLKELQNER